MTDPCELVVEKHFPNKNKTNLKASLNYVKQVAANIKDRGELRVFITNFAKARGLEIGTKILTELDTLGKYALNMDRINSPKWGTDFLQAALSIYEQTSSNVKNAGINIEAIFNSKQKQFFGSFNRDMEAIGFAREFRSGAFDVQIRNVIRTGIKYTGPMAEKINNAASILKRHYSIMNKELNSSGLLVGYRSDYDGPMVHDGSAIFGRYSDWVKSLDKHLDFFEEFKEIPVEEINAFKAMVAAGGDLSEESENQVLKALKSSYDKITQTESMLHDDMPVSMQAPVSIAERRSYSKTFKTWKSGEAVQEYLSEFGKYKTLADQMRSYSHMAAKDIGLVSVLGASPTKGHEMVKTLMSKKMLEAKYTDTEIKAATRQLDIAFNNLARPRIPPAGWLGDMLMNFRSLTAQAKLGTAGVTSLIMDPAVTTLQQRNLMQEGIIKATYNTFKHYIPSLIDAARMGGDSLADMYLFSANDILTSHEELTMLGGGKTGKFLRISGEFVSKASGAYWLNKTAHITNAKMYLGFLADAANGKKMTEFMKADLKKFGVTPDDVAITAKLGLNKTGMRNIFRMTAEEYMELVPSITSVTDAEHLLAAYKDRMSIWLLDKIKKGAPIPGNRERRMLLGDTTPGTIDGEMRRFLMQFKATQHKVFLDTTIGATRTLTPDGPQTGKADWSNKESLYNAGALIGVMTMAGATNMLINAALSLNEKELKRWEKADPTLLAEAFARGGAIGVFGDLFSWKDNKAEMGAQIFMSPAMSAAVTPFTSVTKAVEGNPAKAAIDMGKTFIPGANIWFLKALVQGMSDAASKASEHSSNSKRSGL